MAWALGVVALLVGTVVLAVVAGSLLPKDHVVTRAASYRSAVEDVWSPLLAFEDFPNWRSDVRRVERLPDANGQPSWTEHTKSGSIPLEVLEALAPHRLVTRIASDKLPFGGTWTMVVESAHGNTTLTITERGQVTNPLFRFMAEFVFGYTATIDGYLKSLGKKLGQEVQPGPAAPV